MPIFGSMNTDRSPSSTAPTVDPGVRRYSPSASPVGAMLIDSFEVCSVLQFGGREPHWFAPHVLLQGDLTHLHSANVQSTPHRRPLAGCREIPPRPLAF